MDCFRGDHEVFTSMTKRLANAAVTRANDDEMHPISFRHWVLPALFVILVFGFADSAVAQSDSAFLSGRVTDPSGRVIQGAEAVATNMATNVSVTGETNSEGRYVFPTLKAGRYSVAVTKPGFKQVVDESLILNVQAVVIHDFVLPVGGANETVIVEDRTTTTTSPAVSTVIDRQFIENIPLNGRTLQNLVNLTPGIVVTASGFGDGGQFSVNGQRADSNYFTVDGVSANFGSDVAAVTRTTSGTLPGFSANGTTSNLVSVDAVQEFRIQTSTFAPEFGRTPGAQVSITTRSGTSQFHGTVFDYFRNSVLDASNWFNGFNLVDGKPLPKAAERQNDFGGVVGGPIFRNRTFFFFSYEGQRLSTPSAAQEVGVPTVASRTVAPAEIQPILNAFPLPNTPSTPDQEAAGVGLFTASAPNKSNLNATSLRLDHNVTKTWSVFARYDYAPSTQADQRQSLSVSTTTSLRTQTGTVGTTKTFGTNSANETLFNWTHYNTDQHSALTTFGGAVVPTQDQLYPPSEGVNLPPSHDFELLIFGLGSFSQGSVAKNLQRQINLIDNFSYTVNSHALKFGVDYRRLTPYARPVNYAQLIDFCGVLSCPFGPFPTAVSGMSFVSSILSSDNVGLVFSNYSFYAQDTWQATPRATVTYGARYDINPAPTGQNVQLRRFVNPFDLANLTLAPAGTSLYPTNYKNIAPRVGIAYRVHETPGLETTVRGGFGIFYDLGTNVAGAVATQFPFLRVSSQFFHPYPLTPADAAPPPFSLDPPFGTVTTIDPKITIPRTYQWNAALEQGLGPNQTLSITYVGAAGRDLSRLLSLFPDPAVAQTYLVASSGGSSLYHALQAQYQRRLYQRVQALASYTWSHSIDTQSTNGGFNNGADANIGRASSDFDVRNAVSLALTYEPLGGNLGPIGNLFTHHWAFDAIYVAQTAMPVDLSVPNFLSQTNPLQVRPNFVPGQPLFLHGSQFPGGKALNPAAFTLPPPFPNPGFLGDVPRNFLRGFNLSQLDLALHRQFTIHENVGLQFRAEMFNALNEPNFASYDSGFGDTFFGQSRRTLNDSLGSSSAGSGGLNPLFQIGGPRSIQLALKLVF